MKKALMAICVAGALIAPAAALAAPQDYLDRADVNMIAKSIRTHWNRCGYHDVCVPGTWAYRVNCAQPDPRVTKLECFVSTGSDYGYGIDVTYRLYGTRIQWSWRIQR